MAIDHSLTYQNFKLRNIPHRVRLNALKKLILENVKAPIATYADFGCSNGFLTNIFSDLTKSSKTNGFDHSENVELARLEYPHLNFDYIDLNEINEFSEKYELVTCFETIEHVGNVKTAITSIKNATHADSTVIMSVPIEIGIIGLLKYLVKRFIFRYELPLNCGDSEYFFSLIRNKDISRFRNPQDGYGSHFGFDYRIVDKEIIENFPAQSIRKFNSFTTRYYIIALK